MKEKKKLLSYLQSFDRFSQVHFYYSYYYYFYIYIYFLFLTKLNTIEKTKHKKEN